MDIGSPSGGIIPSVHSKLMLALGETNEPRSGRQLAARADVAHTSAQRVLSQWAELGLVARNEAGNASLFVLNRDHVAAEAFLALVRLRGGLFGRISESIGHWNIRPIAVSVFGSAARGDGSPESDIDLLIVTEWSGLSEEWDAQVEALRRDVYFWSGNHLAALEASPKELDRELRRPGSTWGAIQSEQILIYGELPTAGWRA
jgi:hypothetical protein